MKPFPILVNEYSLRDELVQYKPPGELSVMAEPADEGFSESLYQLLVEAGVVALPTSVIAGLIATWLNNVWTRRGRPADTVVGIEQGDRHNLSLL